LAREEKKKPAIPTDKIVVNGKLQTKPGKWTGKTKARK